MNGATLISNENFKDLILKEKELEDLKKELENIKPNNTYEKLEKKYLDDIYKQESYHIRNLTYFEENNNKIIQHDYHYEQIQAEFLNDGITDFNYINEQILKLRDRYLEENKEATNE